MTDRSAQADYQQYLLYRPTEDKEKLKASEVKNMRFIRREDGSFDFVDLLNDNGATVDVKSRESGEVCWWFGLFILIGSLFSLFRLLGLFRLVGLVGWQFVVDVTLYLFCWGLFVMRWIFLCFGCVDFLGCGFGVRGFCFFGSGLCDWFFCGVNLLGIYR